MTKKMIAVDLDGTLLNSESQLSDFTIETIKKISKKGHQVVIATGRPYRMAKDFYDQLELNQHFLYYTTAQMTKGQFDKTSKYSRRDF